MEGVSGIDAVKDATKIHELQTMCRKMCSWTRHGFPGCQPVSMDTKNIGLLFGMPYKVSWKADGTRYMMLIVRKGEVYLFDRDNTVFAASQFTFLRRKQPNEHIQNTLVDGVSRLTMIWLDCVQMKVLFRNWLLIKMEVT
jgi:mRNA-capping enzyme